jgi:hypothetical protein
LIAALVDVSAIADPTAVQRALRRREDRRRAERRAVHNPRVDWLQHRNASLRGHARREHEHHSHRRDRRLCEKTRQFELKAEYPLAGDTWHQRTVIEPMSANAMTASSYLSFGIVPEWTGVEIKYTRSEN